MLSYGEQQNVTMYMSNLSSIFRLYTSKANTDAERRKGLHFLPTLHLKEVMLLLRRTKPLGK